jgi:hypothetical protein
LQGVQVRLVFRSRRFLVIVLDFGKRALESSLIGGAPEHLQDMTIGAKGGQSREIVVDLARIPAAPIATKAGAEEEKAFHRVLRFESMSLSYI